MNFFVWTAMKVLDGDDVRLSAKGRYAERDIVQVGTLYHCSLVYTLCLQNVHPFIFVITPTNVDRL